MPSCEYKSNRGQIKWLLSYNGGCLMLSKKVSRTDVLHVQNFEYFSAFQYRFYSFKLRKCSFITLYLRRTSESWPVVPEVVELCCKYWMWGLFVDGGLHYHPLGLEPHVTTEQYISHPRSRRLNCFLYLNVFPK